MKLELNNVYCMDCLDGMHMMQEQGIIADWCITDPPYGIGEDGAKNHSRGDRKAQSTKFTPKNWDKKLSLEYFDLIFETSKNQIIFGGNYYADWLPPSSCWIVWDKLNGMSDFADCELAWTSMKKAVRKIEYKWNGLQQGDMKHKEKRIHPTQKPLPLMRQLISRYTQVGDLVLDPFAGSFTTMVACHQFQRNYIGFEKDEEYFEIGQKRLEEVKAQMSMFEIIA